MSDDGFVKEFTGLVKKHFLKKKKKAPKAASKKRFFSGMKLGKKAPEPSVSVGSVHHDSTNISDHKKQEKIENLCEKLFAQKDMISSGKLNFLGLDKIKRRLGKSWEGVKPIVYETVDSVIRQYMEESDLFIRYRDDVYLIIFATASHEEAQIKCALIAEEIRRSMFESEHEELHDMRVQRDVRTVKTETLCGGQGLDEAVDKIFSGTIDVPAADHARRDEVKTVDKKTFEKAEKPSPPRKAHAIEQHSEKQCPTRDPKVEIIQVEAYRPQKSAGQAQGHEEQDSPYEFAFIPVWDTRRSYLSTYICVMEGRRKTDINPFQAHKDIYSDLSHSQKLNHDKMVLRRIIEEQASMKNADQHMFLCCPVHYETLVRDSSFTDYKIACQKIPPELRSFLFFIVMDCPAQVHKSTLSKFVGPLKNYCRFFCGEVPFNGRIDFMSYRVAGFDSLGINMPNPADNVQYSCETMAPILRNFSVQAKKNYISFIFTLGVYNNDLINTAVFPDFDFAAGPAIHIHVQKPDGIYEFRHQDIYSKMNEKIKSGKK